MTRPRQIVVGLIGAAVAAAPLRAEPSAAGASPRPRVILISCDGLRPDAIEVSDAPHLQRLSQTGHYRAACLAEVPSITLPNHTSMLTGLGIFKHGVVLNTDIPGRIKKATVLDVARAGGLRTGFFIGKSKLGFLCREGEADVWQYDGNMAALTDAIVAAIREADLDLMFVHFREPDGAGHAHGWMSEPYLDAVAEVDAAIGRILSAAAETEVAGGTVLILTADHGGHERTHGFSIPEDRHVPFIIHGADYPAAAIEGEVRVMDMGATALHLLGLPTDIAVDGRAILPPAVADEVAGDVPTMPVGVPCGLMVLAAPAVLYLAWRGQRVK